MEIYNDPHAYSRHLHRDELSVTIQLVLVELMEITTLHATGLFERVCLVCVHGHMLSTKFYKFGGF